MKTNRKLANSKYPIELRISHKSLQSLYIRIDGLTAIDETEFSNILSRFTRKKNNYKPLNTILPEIEEKADSII